MTFAIVTEILMVIAFGAFLPVNLIKSLKNKNNKGKSLLTLMLMAFGFLCGVISKITTIIVTNDDKALIAVALIFYIINFAMAAGDLALYFHYRSMEKMREEIEAEQEEEDE